MRVSQQIVLAYGAALWLLTVGTGLAMLWNYSRAPGEPATPPRDWPTESRVPSTSDHATLLVFVHPQCPCTRATLGELALLIAHTESRLRAHVLMWDPTGIDDTWAATDLWQTAAAIPGVTVTRDEGATEAARFHVATSGQVILYDTGGHLRFSGGITPARGHSGDNIGRDAIEALVTEGAQARAETPVFGCALRSADAL